MNLNKTVPSKDPNQFCVLTSIGEEKINAHAVAGTKLVLTNFVLGDGNGSPVTPSKERNALVNEIGRESITETNPSYVSGGIFMSHAMADKYQGKWIREAGLIDADGDLIVYGSYSPTLVSLFTERTMIINLPTVSSDTIEIRIDPLKKWVTQSQLDAIANNAANQIEEVHTRLGSNENFLSSMSLKVDENRAEIEKLKQQKPSSGGEWTLLREVAYADLPTNKGLLLGTIKTVLENGYKVVGYNADNEPVFLPQMLRVGTSESQQTTGNWKCFWIRSNDGMDVKQHSNISSECVQWVTACAYLLSSSPRLPMTFALTPDKTHPVHGQHHDTFSWADGHSDFDLAAAGLTKSDNLYAFFKPASAAMTQDLVTIKVFERAASTKNENKSYKPWELVREVNYAELPSSKGLLLGTVQDLLTRGFKVTGYSATGERVFLPFAHSIGNSEASQVTNGWLNLWVYAREGSSNPMTDTYETNRIRNHAKASSYLLSNSPQNTMTLSITPDRAHPLYGTAINKGPLSWSDGHAELNLASQGLSQSDNVYIFFDAADDHMKQAISKIKVFIGVTE
ncbi:phage tail protein [Vibrio vulnificus]|nr:phage tail protein [Vibrio vulnificus]